MLARVEVHTTASAAQRSARLNLLRRQPLERVVLVLHKAAAAKRLVHLTDARPHNTPLSDSHGAEGSRGAASARVRRCATSPRRGSAHPRLHHGRLRLRLWCRLWQRRVAMPLARRHLVVALLAHPVRHHTPDRSKTCRDRLQSARGGGTGCARGRRRGGNAREADPVRFLPPLQLLCAVAERGALPGKQHPAHLVRQLRLRRGALRLLRSQAWQPRHASPGRTCACGVACACAAAREQRARGNDTRACVVHI